MKHSKLELTVLNNSDEICFNEAKQGMVHSVGKWTVILYVIVILYLFYYVFCIMCIICFKNGLITLTHII